MESLLAILLDKDTVYTKHLINLNMKECGITIAKMVKVSSLSQTETILGVTGLMMSFMAKFNQQQLLVIGSKVSSKMVKNMDLES